MGIDTPDSNVGTLDTDGFSDGKLLGIWDGGSDTLSSGGKDASDWTVGTLDRDGFSDGNSLGYSDGFRDGIGVTTTPSGSSSVGLLVGGQSAGDSATFCWKVPALSSPRD